MAKKQKTDEVPAEDPVPNEDTPSGAALAKVGPAPEDGSPEELTAHGERYLKEKLKHRHGY
jgi:hypothetical protein